MILEQDKFLNSQEGALPRPDLLIVILGPTASGKTKLGVELAKHIQGEIISVDSRQVYRGMNIGTGKDIAEYDGVNYHLIDILNPGEKYNVAHFNADFELCYDDILRRKAQPIAVGGTGLYLQSILSAKPYINVPIDLRLRETLAEKTKTELAEILVSFEIPSNLAIDYSTHKRMIRAIEILENLKSDAGFQLDEVRSYPSTVFGIDPSLELRRSRISNRLKARVEEGLIEEVEELLAAGVTHDQLQYYGLEYKYISLYLLGEMDRSSFMEKLETEIHRYAKRQMTFFRKMEKDGIQINWLRGKSHDERLQELLQTLEKTKQE